MSHDCTSVCDLDQNWSTVSTRIGPLLCFCSQHMSRPKNFFSCLGLLSFGIVTPAQVSETSSRSQRGGSVMASNSSSATAQRNSATARKSQVAVAIALTVCE